MSNRPTVGVVTLSGVRGFFRAGTAGQAFERIARIQVGIDRLTLLRGGFLEQFGADSRIRGALVVQDHQGFDIAAHQVFQFLFFLGHPLINPAHHGVLFFGQVAHDAKGVVEYQVQMVVFVGRQHLAFDDGDGGLFEQGGVFPDVVLSFLRVNAFCWGNA